jgi:hypothetical protein
MSRAVALATAEIESRIEAWPAGCSDDLIALIYGDFIAPEQDLEYPIIGITVKAEKLTNTIIHGALCVLRAQVKVSEKSLEAVLDAAARLNTLLGVWTGMDWGNRSVGWWCHITHGTMAGAGGPFEKEGAEQVIAGLPATKPPQMRLSLMRRDA